MKLRLTGIFPNAMGDLTSKSKDYILEVPLPSSSLFRKVRSFAENELYSEDDAMYCAMPTDVFAKFPELRENVGTWSADLGCAIGYVIAQYME